MKIIRNCVIIVSFIALCTWLYDGGGAEEAVGKGGDTSRRLRSSSLTDAERKVSRSTRFDYLVDSNLSWRMRVDKLNRLNPDTLSESDVDRLYELLDYKHSEKSSESWWVILNEIMEQIRMHGLSPSRVSDSFMKIALDSSNDGVTRDYAIQHLGYWISDRREVDSYDISVKQSDEAIKTIVSLITDQSLAQSSIPGTGLMILVTIKDSGIDIDEQIKALRPWMKSVIDGSNQTSLPTRVSTIVASGMLGDDAFLPVIRHLSISKNVDASIRLPSIAALGQLGDSSDLPALGAIASSSHRLRFAAQSAVSSIIKNSNAGSLSQ